MTVALGPIVVKTFVSVLSKCTYCGNTCTYLKGDLCNEHGLKVADVNNTPDWCRLKQKNLFDARDK